MVNHNQELQSAINALDWNTWSQEQTTIPIDAQGHKVRRYGPHESIKSLFNTQLSARLGGVFGLPESAITNAAELQPQLINPLSFVARYSKPEIDTYWKYSSIGKKAAQDAGVSEISIEDFLSQRNPIILGANPYAGMGHMIESALWLQLLMAITGVKSWLVQPEEFMTGISKKLFGANATLHDFMQNVGLTPEVYAQTFGEILNDAQGLNEKLTVQLTEKLVRFALAGAGEDKTSNDGLAEFARKARLMLNTTPEITKFVLRTLVTLDMNIREAPLATIIQKIHAQAVAEGYDVALIDGSHPFILRGIGDELADKSHSLMSDRGYHPIAKVGQKLSPADIGSLLQVFANGPGDDDAPVIVTPSAEITNGLRDIYNNRGQIVEAGELLDSLTPEELAEKWATPERNIALMVNGNASNRGMIKHAVLDFIKQGCPEKYNLAVCIWDRDLKEIFGDDAEFVQEALNTRNNLRVIQTTNKLEAAHLARYIPRWAHMRIGKPPGENVFMTAAVGCLEVCGNTKMANEINNMYLNLDKAIMCTFPKGSGDTWRQALEGYSDDIKGQAAIGLSIEDDNFVGYLDKLDSNDFAKNFTINGYLRSEHLNTLHNLMATVAQMSEGKLTNAAQDEIVEFMVGAKIRFDEHMYIKMSELFGFSPQETLARILGKEVDQLTQEDRILPNKYIDLLERRFTERHAQEEAEKKKRLAILGGLAIASGLIAAGFIFLNQKKQNEKD